MRGRARKLRRLRDERCGRALGGVGRIPATFGVQQFTYRSARSGSFIAGIVLALLAETLVIHLWIVGRHPLVAWLLTISSLGAVAWLVADYLAMGRGAIGVGHDELALDIGRRFSVRRPRARVMSAALPTWRDLPEAGTPAASDYLNLTKPATPNVLLTLHEPTRVRIRGGIFRTARRIGLHVDDPERLVTLLASAS